MLCFCNMYLCMVRLVLGCCLQWINGRWVLNRLCVVLCLLVFERFMMLIRSLGKVQFVIVLLVLCFILKFRNSLLLLQRIDSGWSELFFWKLCSVEIFFRFGQFLCLSIMQFVLFVMILWIMVGVNIIESVRGQFCSIQGILGLIVLVVCLKQLMIWLLVCKDGGGVIIMLVVFVFIEVLVSDCMVVKFGVEMLMIICIFWVCLMNCIVICLVLMVLSLGVLFRIFSIVMLLQLIFLQKLVSWLIECLLIWLLLWNGVGVIVKVFLVLVVSFICFFFFWLFWGV